MNYLIEVQAQFTRWMIHFRRQPVFVLFAVMQPFFWLLLFSQAFARTMASSPYSGMEDYTAFITAAVLVMTVFNNSMSGGIALLFDRERGTLSRILAAPISRSSILIGRFLAVSVISLLQVVVILALSRLLGVKLATGLPGGAMIILLTLLFGLGITILSLSLAFIFSNHASFFAILGFISLPLIFVSSALVPLEAMPGWLRLMAQANPMTYCIDGVRMLIQQPAWNLPRLGQMAGALVLFDIIALLLGTRVISRRIG